MWHHRLANLLPFLSLAALPSCDAQADVNYLGEPLVTLQGVVVSNSATLPPLEAAMLWQRGPPPSNTDQELATLAPVETGFPATFTLRLYQPPPAAARRKLLPGQVTYARANAAAMPFGTAVQPGQAVAASAPSVSGIDVDHWLIYLDADVPLHCLMDGGSAMRW